MNIIPTTLVRVFAVAMGLLHADICFGAPHAIPSVNDMPISQARHALKLAGWEPRRTALDRGDGIDENQWGDARMLYQAGYVEVESCSGTGANYCFFNYRQARQCVRLLTVGEFKLGEYEPKVVSHSRQCPAPQAIPKTIP